MSGAVLRFPGLGSVAALPVFSAALFFVWLTSVQAVRMTQALRRANSCPSAKAKRMLQLDASSVRLEIEGQELAFLVLLEQLFDLRMAQGRSRLVDDEILF